MLLVLWAENEHPVLIAPRSEHTALPCFGWSCIARRDAAPYDLSHILSPLEGHGRKQEML
jgi:hypothetical protein